MVELDKAQKRKFDGASLGFGIAYPFEIDARTGGVECALGEIHVGKSIIRILDCNRFDLPGAPMFGANIRHTTFSVMSVGTSTKVATNIKIAIQMFEDRVENVEVIVRPKYPSVYQRQAKIILVIVVLYQVKSGSKFRLVYQASDGKQLSADVLRLMPGTIASIPSPSYGDV